MALLVAGADAAARVGLRAEAQLVIPRSQTNLYGSGISIGHPPGATGIRMTSRPASVGRTQHSHQPGWHHPGWRAARLNPLAGAHRQRLHRLGSPHGAT